MNHQEKENKVEFENFKEFSLSFPTGYKVETVRKDNTVLVYFYPKKTLYVRNKEYKQFTEITGKLFMINSKAYICKGASKTLTISKSGGVLPYSTNYTEYGDLFILILELI